MGQSAHRQGWLKQGFRVGHKKKWDKAGVLCAELQRLENQIGSRNTKLIRAWEKVKWGQNLTLSVETRRKRRVWGCGSEIRIKKQCREWVLHFTNW